jgi:hypothetical protein
MKTIVCMTTLLLGCAPDGVEPNGYSRDGAGALDGGAPIDARLSEAASAASAVAEGGGSAMGDGTCNLAGRWLVAQHTVATAIGQEQAAHNWFYYEIRQEGAALLVTKGLHCGYEVIKRTSLGASVDSSAAWPAFLLHNSSAGRRGSFAKDVAGCRLKMEKEYTVRGATVAHYQNPGTKLPGKDQPASGAMPGWEDWDGDGNPGISLKVSSTLASGTLYTCQRDWTEYDGVIAGGPVKLKVAITYGGEQVALGRAAGTPAAVESASSPSSNPAHHYAWFHRLEPAQAAGSDAEICAAVRTLKGQLVPEAQE